MQVAVVGLSETTLVEPECGLTAEQHDSPVSQEPDQTTDSSDRVVQSHPLSIVESTSDLDVDIEVTEDEKSDNETKEFVLKGILKHQHIYGLDKKNVNFDLDIAVIPYNDQDYTVYIEIVKELPKRVVSYKELFKQRAEEEKLAKERAAADEKDVDGEEDEVEVKPFGHLVLKEPTIHHSLNDIDLKAAKELKLLMKQNGKNDDTANTCQQDSSQKENEFIYDKTSNVVLGNGKFSVVAVDESWQCNPTLCSDTLNTNERPEENTTDATPRYDSDEIEIVGNRFSQGESEDALIPKINEYEFADYQMLLDYNLEETNYNSSKILLPEAGKFNCDHEYFYSCESSSGELDSAVQNKNLHQVEEKSSTENKSSEPEPFANNSSDLLSENDNETVELSTDQLSFCSDELSDDRAESKAMDLDDASMQGVLCTVDVGCIIEETSSVKEETGSTNLTAGSNDDFERITSMKYTDNSVSISQSVNNFSEGLSSSPEVNQIETSDSINKKIDLEHGGSADELFINRRAAKEMNGDALVNGCLRWPTKDVAIQTEFDFPLSSHCLHCTCSPGPEAVRQGHDVDQSILQTSSSNPPEDILMLAAGSEPPCQDNCLVASATASLESHYKDFTHSANLNCSSSL